MDTGKLLMVGGLGFAGYYAWKWYQDQQAAAAASPVLTATAVPVAPVVAPVIAPVVPVPVPVVAPVAVPGSLDAVYSKLKTAAYNAGVDVSAGTANGQPVDPNGWNYYLNTVYSLPGGAMLPGGLFPASAQSQPMSLSSYWAVMAPYLQAGDAGPSGLGIYGGLGALVRAYR